MPVKFQSEDYFEAANAALKKDEDALKASKGHNVEVQVITTDFPQEGEKKTYLRIKEGVPDVGIGELEDPDAVITQDYETAVALDKGELNPQTAFMEGKMKIKGNLMKIMQLQKFMKTLEPATSDIEREY
ncbi:MAG: SCP2 sterol-binding domain-containing protein [Actinomycetota bacterium]